ncbi:MAG: indolepyruvate ferredoxin oxidoreductase family protein [Propylenella sp.]
MARHGITLGDKYDLGKDRVFVSGTQAIVRLALMRKELDRRAGLNTAGFISGYRGSPLGGLDQQLWRAGKLLEENDIVFQPGLNEDLAATAVWGSQQAELRGEGRYDGVFGIWYGKGPGVDRSGDALRHANFDGTSKHGGVIALMGDDHTCESSTTAHQSEFAFVDAMMPILNPAGVQEILDYGLIGWELSRFAGVWVGLKCVKDNIEATGSIDASFGRLRVVRPDVPMPPAGLNIRTGRTAVEKEELLHRWRRPAMLAFLRENRLDYIAMGGGPRPQLGIVSLGKSWLDTLGALDILGIDEKRAADLGLRLYKVAAPWPLEPTGVNRFADGLETILVVEEKRSLVETQLKEQLYGRAAAPMVVGKRDEQNNVLLPAWGALDANQIALIVAKRILAYAEDSEIAARLKQLEHVEAVVRTTENVGARTPHFCAGCPHNTSTVVPEGSRAYAGIGCHYMALWMDRGTEGFTHMGAEGANWIGEAPFSTREHVFQNLGDGTYAHSGALAIRAAAAAGVNITYKILYNDAVAMTGGQPVEGGMTVDMVARQVVAEGAKRVALVTDDPYKYPSGTKWPAGLTIHHRSGLADVQEELRRVKGLSVLIYDQTCAAEKRRRRKRGTYPDPDKRVVINSLVCEGCGDCGIKSNCVAIQPLDTEFGRKRKIDQSSCNKDYSCLEGFCPSFVTVHGARLKKGAAASPDRLPPVPEPALRPLDRAQAILITGVGGTGVVTVGAIVGMAAHIDGLGVGIIDMAGLAQKGGAVTTHMRIAPKPEEIHAIRIAAEEADTVLACDIVVAGSKSALAAIRPGETRVFVNRHETYPGDFTREADFSLPIRRLERAIEERAGAGRAHFVEAQRLAVALLGDAIATNMFMVGFAWQQGGLPVSRGALLEAIRLNGVDPEMNAAAFEWGRRAAVDFASVELAAGLNLEPERAPTLSDIVDRRVAFLTAYQNARYAARYKERVEQIAGIERRLMGGETAVAAEVAHALFKLMAVKDEYEVARLYTDGSFERQLKDEFGSWGWLQFHLAPPLFARRDKRTGQLKKQKFGPWMMGAFRLLARLRFLRPTFLSPFRYTAERRWERQLLKDYESDLDVIEAKLSAENSGPALALASYPLRIRGFGHVKEAQARPVLAERDRLVHALDEPAQGELLQLAAE